MTEASRTDQDPTPDLAERAGYLLEVAARAPSVHNTQPWRFAVTGDTIELYAAWASDEVPKSSTKRQPPPQHARPNRYPNQLP